MFVEFLANEDGATAIEYGLLLALISLASIIAFEALGLSLVGVFITISQALQSAFIP